MTPEESLAEDIVGKAVFTTSAVQDAFQSSLTVRNIDTTADINNVFGEDLNITLVDDFTALDGASAIETDEIKRPMLGLASLNGVAQSGRPARAGTKGRVTAARCCMSSAMVLYTCRETRKMKSVSCEVT
ncbi:hypothetical protein [Pseudosulfitobacter sp. SM2401]|uniref:hypothetical protein n=1 Tax=Pseudosulfitobacter sp. SM2401 TaxID=3350098 RepID=UPI0036F39DA8